MSKVTAALGSFSAGVCSVLLFLMLSGSHTSTLAQLPKQAVFPGAEPTVPPLQNAVFTGTAFRGGEQQLDGLNCEECSFTDVTFTYAGGASRLVNPKFSGTTRVTFKGAAANALMTSAFLQSMLQNKKPPPTRQNDPIIKAALVKEAFTADLVTPYGQK